MRSLREILKPRPCGQYRKTEVREVSFKSEAGLHVYKLLIIRAIFFGFAGL